MYGGVDDHFLEHPVAMALNKVDCSLCAKVPFLLSAQSFDFSIVCKMTSSRVSFIIEFSAREAFQAAENEYDLVSIFGLPILFCLYSVFAFEIISSTYCFACLIWLCVIPLAAFCGLVVPVISWFFEIIGSCSTGV